MNNRRGQFPPNALRHGAFAKSTILPGEDPREFEELHSALIEEWQPNGPTEYDAVLNIANGIWRKRRIQRFLEAQIARGTIDVKHPAYDEGRALILFCDILKVDPDQFEQALGMLPEEHANHLRQEFVRENFATTSEWIRAIRREVFSNLLKRAMRFGEKRAVVSLEQSASYFPQEVFDHELAVDERVDHMIERAIKRLICIKSVKPTLLDHVGGQRIQKISRS
jgi:hypothetical protein